MATLMQKDVMVEVIAGLRARLHKHEDKNGSTKETQAVLNELLDKRRDTYFSSPEELNFPEFIVYKNSIKAKYSE